MKWVKLPEIKPGTKQEHFFAYCWSCQKDKFVPGIPLVHQLYLNPFIHTEPICEECARTCDPNFGEGTKLELCPKGHLRVTDLGDEPECPHNKGKSFYQVLPSMKIYLACSRKCAEGMEKKGKEEWKSFCERIGLGE